MPERSSGIWAARADSDENVQEEVTAMLAWAGTCSCISEERRDNARTKFWHMSCLRGQR